MANINKPTDTGNPSSVSLEKQKEIMSQFIADALVREDWYPDITALKAAGLKFSSEMLEYFEKNFKPYEKLNGGTHYSFLKNMGERFGETKGTLTLEALLNTITRIDISKSKIYDKSHPQKNHIPPLVRKCSNVEDLDLSGNLLEIIPEELSMLKNLKALRISDNNFGFGKDVAKDLPKDFCVPRLETIDISDNDSIDITRITPSRFPALKKILAKECRENNKTKQYIQTLKDQFPSIDIIVG